MLGNEIRNGVRDLRDEITKGFEALQSENGRNNGNTFILGPMIPKNA